MKDYSRQCRTHELTRAFITRRGRLCAAATIVAILAGVNACGDTPMQPETPRLALSSRASAMLVSGPQTYQVDPQGSFILTEDEDHALAPLIIDLSTLGVGPGDQLHLEQLGTFTYTIYDVNFQTYGTETARALEAVFSSSAELRSSSELHRVPGAIGIGLVYPTPSTLFKNLSTDIPEDFWVRDITVTIPAGARYLFVAVPDSWYKDNLDANGDFGVRITPVVAPPGISVSVNPVLPASGWFTTDVTISWTVTGPVISSTGCNAVTVDSDTPGATFFCSASTAGGTTTKSYTLKRDATPPVIVFSGNTIYNLDQAVSVTCSASDALSGIATSSCPGASGEAYTFAGTPSVLTATATDVAGNSITRSATINVLVTRNGLCALVTRWVSSSGVANSLCVKLDQQSHESFKNELSAQAGKKITEENVAVLTRLVDLLPPE